MQQETSTEDPDVEKNLPEGILKSSRILQVKKEKVTNNDYWVKEQQCVHANSISQYCINPAKKSGINWSNDVSDKGCWLYNNIPEEATPHHTGDKLID